jgi:hypothetical protein
MSDFDDWCDEHLPELYNVGMFDSEEISDEVWEAVNELANETILEYIDDPTEREETSEALLDAAREWFQGHHDLMVEAISTETPDELLTRPQTSQHSADWYAQRRNRLTASEFAQILDGRRGALLRQKIDTSATGDRPTQAPVAIAQGDGEMIATSWGHRFEPVTRDIYELELAGVGTVCDTLGRFTHQIHPWLSASPDGVVLKGPLAGRLVEIKSPKSRIPGDFVPSEYYVQMQIQMEVCNIDAVDFIEARFAQGPADDYDEEAATEARWKGRIQVYGHLESPETWTYRYSEPVEDLDDAVMPPPPADDLPLLEDSVWWLISWHPRTVLRNPEWWAEEGWPAAELFWSEVQSLRDVSPPAAASVADATKIEHVGGWMGR